MSQDLKLKVSIKEKNDRGQEVELVCKTIQFKPQVCWFTINFDAKSCAFLLEISVQEWIRRLSISLSLKFVKFYTISQFFWSVQVFDIPISISKQFINRLCGSSSQSVLSISSICSELQCPVYVCITHSLTETNWKTNSRSQNAQFCRQYILEWFSNSSLSFHVTCHYFFAQNSAQFSSQLLQNDSSMYQSSNIFFTGSYSILSDHSLRRLFANPRTFIRDQRLRPSEPIRALFNRRWSQKGGVVGPRSNPWALLIAR